jgi:hypothetical protein
MNNNDTCKHGWPLYATMKCAECEVERKQFDPVQYQQWAQEEMEHTVNYEEYYG